MITDDRILGIKHLFGYTMFPTKIRDLLFHNNAPTGFHVLCFGFLYVYSACNAVIDITIKHYILKSLFHYSECGLQLHFSFVLNL